MTQKHKKIVMADQDKIDVLEPWIEKILIILGFPNSFVSDDSYLSDFIPMVLHEDPNDENSPLVSLWDDKDKYKLVYKKHVEKLANTLNIELTGKEYFWMVAEKLKESENIQ